MKQRERWKEKRNMEEWQRKNNGRISEGRKPLRGKQTQAIIEKDYPGQAPQHNLNEGKNMGKTLQQANRRRIRAVPGGTDYGNPAMRGDFKKPKKRAQKRELELSAAWQKKKKADPGPGAS